MAEEPRQESLRERFGTRGEEVVGRIAQDLLDSPWFNSVLSASQWVALISRLGQIPNPQVGSGPSSEAIADSPPKSEGSK